MKKSNNFETMKMESLKEIENNIQQNDLQEAILGMMWFAGTDIEVGLLIDGLSTGELIKLDLIESDEDICWDSDIKTMKELEDERFYFVEDNIIGGKYTILKINKEDVEAMFDEIKEAC